MCERCRSEDVNRGGVKTGCRLQMVYVHVKIPREAQRTDGAFGELWSCGLRLMIGSVHHQA